MASSAFGSNQLRPIWHSDIQCESLDWNQSKWNCQQSFWQPGRDCRVCTCFLISIGSLDRIAICRREGFIRSVLWDFRSYNRRPRTRHLDAARLGPPGAWHDSFSSAEKPNDKIGRLQKLKLDIRLRSSRTTPTDYEDSTRVRLPYASHQQARTTICERQKQAGSMGKRLPTLPRSSYGT